MDELTGEKKKEFKQIRTLLQEFLEEMDVLLQEQGHEMCIRDSVFRSIGV